MTDRTSNVKTTTNLQRRKVLQGGAAVMVAGVAPALSAGMPSEAVHPKLTGKLICNIADPIKTLVIHNPTDNPVEIAQLANSALMFDGSIVDCNNALVIRNVTVPAKEEVSIRFPQRHPQALKHDVQDYQRVQSRVTRLSDGTRVIPFETTVRDRVATFV